jgi:hypothetical protein
VSEGGSWVSLPLRSDRSRLRHGLSDAANHRLQLDVGVTTASHSQHVRCATNHVHPRRQPTCRARGELWAYRVRLVVVRLFGAACALATDHWQLLAFRDAAGPRRVRYRTDFVGRIRHGVSPWVPGKQARRSPCRSSGRFHRRSGAWNSSSRQGMPLKSTERRALAAGG